MEPVLTSTQRHPRQRAICACALKLPFAWNTHSESGTHRRSAHRVTGTLKCHVGGSKNTSFHPKCDGKSQRVLSRVAG